MTHDPHWPEVLALTALFVLLVFVLRDRDRVMGQRSARNEPADSQTFGFGGGRR